MLQFIKENVYSLLPKSKAYAIRCVHDRAIIFMGSLTMFNIQLLACLNLLRSMRCAYSNDEYTVLSLPIKSSEMMTPYIWINISCFNKSKECLLTSTKKYCVRDWTRTWSRYYFYGNFNHVQYTSFSVSEPT